MRDFLNKARVSAWFRLKRMLMALGMQPAAPTPFVILGHPRSGTTLLHVYLNTHLRVLSLGEHIGDLMRNGRRPSPQAYIGAYIARKRPWPIEAVGVKVFCEYLENAEARPLVEALAGMPNLHVIHLQRKGALSMLASRKIAEKTQQWSRTHGTKPLPLEQRRIWLTPDECLGELKRMEALEGKALALFRHCPTLSVSYEALAESPTETLASIQAFLGLPQERLYTPLIKQNPEPLSMLIENYDELMGGLRQP